MATIFKKYSPLSLLLIIFSFAIPNIAHTEQQEVPDEGPILVRLPTASQLLPLYLNPVQSDNSRFSSTYLAQIEGVLSFDLNNNGATQGVERTASRQKLAQEPFTSTSLQKWKAESVFYIITPTVTQETLSTLIASTTNATVKKIDGIPLTGNIDEDRRHIHQLADAIHKELFGTEGVASTRVLYTVRDRHNSKDPLKWTAEVWQADYDGGNAHQITYENTLCVTPSYLPPKPGYGSGSFFYTSYKKTGQPKIYVASLRDGLGTRLSTLPGNQFMPVCSPQRDLIAFISDAAGNPDLFIQEFGPEIGTIGKAKQLFSSTRATQGSPTFSPDGNKIAFVSNKDGVPRIYTIDVPKHGQKPNLSSIKLITRANRENTSPAWSPDGTKLAYSAKADGTRQIWVYEFASGRERQLTQGASHKENPTWASNSLHLMFNSSENNSSELYLINLNQPHATKITQGQGEKRFPNWEARQ
ncbi:Tol-Pal system protein TolB [Simkania negevensis]|uniref:Protein TolB homolog n=1 Tax=Simkania negevensis TaxID=83561 RepID=A0ABS3ARU4_9BACT|nr:Tol-Pal system protein TolB [Simkania negevensis]